MEFNVDLIYTVAALVAVILPAFNFLALYIQRKALHTPRGRSIAALQDKVRDTWLLTIASSGLAILGWNRIIELTTGWNPLTGTPSGLVIVALVVILISTPSILFLWRYYRDGF